MKNYFWWLLLFLAPSLWAAPSVAPVSASSWTATVTNISSDNQGNQIVSLHFDDGIGDTYDVADHVPFGAPPTQISDFVAQTIAGLVAQQVVVSSAPAVGSTVTPTPAPTTGPPDPNAAIKAQFQTDYLLLKQMEALVNHKILPATDTAYLSQITTVQNEITANRTILLPLVQTGL